MSKVLDNTTWDNSKYFTSINDKKIQEILDKRSSEIEPLSVDCSVINTYLDRIESLDKNELDKVLTLIAKSFKTINETFIELQTITTYASSLTSVNAKDEAAVMVTSKASKVISDMGKVTSPIGVFIMKASDEMIDELLKKEGVREREFKIKYSRKMKDFELSSEVESLITGLETDGLHAWGKLYRTLSGSLKCTIDNEEIGFSKAANILRGDGRDKREAAWRAINKAWGTHEESVAAILNSINGWRLECFKTKSKKRELHYLDVSCHTSRIERKTLNSLMSTTFENRRTGQRALKAMAKVIGVEKLGPWDQLAPAPARKEDAKIYSFKEGMEIIVKAFSGLSPEMGEFAKMMADNNWIDSKASENRAAGAYCTKFVSSREPRVFMTYDGTMGNVLTLAHELGHAYHNWVMRDMDLEKTNYPMTLAETASIFAETLVRDYLWENSSEEDRLEIAWQDAESAGAMLCNIPSRFEFEERMVEARKERPLSVSELKDMMSDSWKLWYEDSLSEYDDMFWASKLHFSISGLGFYNYPYLFGYLFSLGLYALKDSYGDDFNDLYIAILRDTGSMTAEDLIQKHLGKDIRTSDFWQGSLDIVSKSIDRFENEI